MSNELRHSQRGPHSAGAGAPSFDNTKLFFFHYMSMWSKHSQVCLISLLQTKPVNFLVKRDSGNEWVNAEDELHMNFSNFLKELDRQFGVRGVKWLNKKHHFSGWSSKMIYEWFVLAEGLSSTLQHTNSNAKELKFIENPNEGSVHKVTVIMASNIPWSHIQTFLLNDLNRVAPFSISKLLVCVSPTKHRWDVDPYPLVESIFTFLILSKPNADHGIIISYKGALTSKT